MRIPFRRSVGVAALLLAGLTAVPTRAADATLPMRALTAMPTVTLARASRTIAVSDLPNERRSVVMVYQGAVAAPVVRR